MQEAVHAVAEAGHTNGTRLGHYRVRPVGAKRYPMAGGMTWPRFALYVLHPLETLHPGFSQMSRGLRKLNGGALLPQGRELGLVLDTFSLLRCTSLCY